MCVMYMYDVCIVYMCVYKRHSFRQVGFSYARHRRVAHLLFTRAPTEDLQHQYPDGVLHSVGSREPPDATGLLETLEDILVQET
jgi:hypothetical protein